MEKHIDEPERDDDTPIGVQMQREKLGIGQGANARQVAGSHYGGSAHQHWDIVVEYNLDYFQGQITKYVMRHWDKNGVQDLEKARHFLEKYIEEIRAERMKRLVPKV